jgi:hypothetical protein
MKYYILVLLLLEIDINVNAQIIINDKITQSKPDKLFVGEDLTYVVKYAFFNLGEVRFKVLEKTLINNTSVFKTIAYIDSYPDLPFISLHQVYISYIDSSLFPLKFFAKIFRDDTVYVIYDFVDDSSVQIQKGKVGVSKPWLDSTVVLKQKVQDGLSILFYTRMNFRNHKNISVPSFVNEKVELTTINFQQDREPVSIEAVDYKIDCLRMDGKTDFVSVYGLTGDFEGWFSNDVFSVPIRAEMNVLIGSIELELIEWNEKIWNPPSYKN